MRPHPVTIIKYERILVKYYLARKQKIIEAVGITLGGDVGPGPVTHLAERLAELNFHCKLLLFLLVVEIGVDFVTHLWPVGSKMRHGGSGRVLSRGAPEPALAPLRVPVV